MQRDQWIFAYVRRENGLYRIYVLNPVPRSCLSSETNVAAVKEQLAAPAMKKAE
jgi:hypothetical protein